MSAVIAVTIIGGITTAIGAVVGVIRGGKTVAVEAAEKAVSTVRDAMETQGAEVTDLRTRVTNQETQITTLGARVEDVTKRHGVAVSHIAEREDAADEHLGPDRPAWLPPIPDLIRPDVDAARRPR